MARLLAIATIACLSSGGALAATDATHGAKLFKSRCGACHSAKQGGPAIMGPTLYGVVGRPAASVPGFSYSKAMKASGITWSDDKLTAYLPAPQTLVHGTKMAFAGLKQPGDVADVVAYLDTLK